MMFFERQKTIRGEWPTVFSRDSIPENVRIQCWQLLDPDEYICEEIVQSLRHTLGVFKLNNYGSPTSYESYSYYETLA